MEERAPARLALNPHEARTAAALFERILPADENGLTTLEDAMKIERVETT